MSSHTTVSAAGHPGVGYERIVERFVSWARTQSDIRAALVVGCRADKVAAADSCFGLEIAVVTNSAREFCQDESWLAELGDWVLSFQTTGPTGLPERRMLDTNGLDVTFVAVSTEAVERAIASGEFSGLGPLLHRNMRVILDQDGLIPRLVARLHNPPPRLPTETEFLNAV
ncbi:MAG: aminoglycoside 6-adenylyltransferase, partial [candidate division WOR-3 bacterium]